MQLQKTQFSKFANLAHWCQTTLYYYAKKVQIAKKFAIAAVKLLNVAM
jgi:hypothetical protein